LADKKISELTELTNADSNDVLAIVDITAGATKKIQAGNLVAASGELTIDVSSGSFDYLKTPIAPLVTEDFGANGKQQTNRLDDTTEEYVTFQRQAPHRSITGMKVYVEVYCKAVAWVSRVAAASNNLAGDLEIEHVRLRFDV